MKVKKARLAEKCGDCVGYDYLKQFEQEGLCIDRGMLSSSSACPSYRPNAFELAESVENPQTNIPILAQAMRAIPTSQLRLFASVIAHERTTRRNGYHFMEVIYYRYRGTAESDFMSNFMKAHVLYATKDHLFLTDPTMSMRMTVVNHKQKKGPSIYTTFNFMQLREFMVDAEQRVDPSLKRNRRSTPEADEGLVSEISAIHETGVKVNGARREPSEEHAPHDLIRIFSTLNKGHYVHTNEDELNLEEDMPEEEDETSGLRTFMPRQAAPITLDRKRGK
jgi:hypothetical protein